MQQRKIKNGALRKVFWKIFIINNNDSIHRSVAQEMRWSNKHWQKSVAGNITEKQFISKFWLLWP